MAAAAVCSKAKIMALAYGNISGQRFPQIYSRHPNRVTENFRHVVVTIWADQPDLILGTDLGV